MMPDLTLGSLPPSDPGKALSRAAEKLGIPVPSDPAKIERVARALHDTCDAGFVAEFEDGTCVCVDGYVDFLALARAAIAAVERP